MRTVTLIPGDGTGPEVIDAAVRCISAAGADIDWDVQIAGESTIKKYRTPLPEHVLDSIRENKVCLKGPITTPVGAGFRSVNVALRQSLDLFANVRPVKSFQGLKSRYKDVDLVVIRENTEDLYAGIEYQNRSDNARKLAGFLKKTGKNIPRTDTGISIKLISHYATKRIAEFAFRYAKENKREKITAVHKANIMKYTDGLFLKTSAAVARRHRSVKFEDRIIDNLCMQMVEDPTQFDVLLCPNLYGDILSDLCAGLAGGIGIAPSANIGQRAAVFEPVHGSAPKYAGKNKVNPGAAILSGAMMLRHIGEIKASEKIGKAFAGVIRERKHVTYDLGGKAGTKQMADAVIKKIR